MLDQPLLDTKNEIQKKRKYDNTSIKKNWIDFACLKKELRVLRKEVFAYPKNGVMTKDQYHRI